MAIAKSFVINTHQTHCRAMGRAHIAARGQAAVFQNTELDKPIERNEFSSARAARAASD